jgi:uroporphyrin-III C-methyltransferase
VSFVSLVGAGPGDPELITLRGLERLRTCSALVHDVLVSDELVREAPRGALVVSREGMQQEEVNRLLVRLARQGRRVVRLKGGDPFVFGRGGEEALALAEAGIPFEIVPGVSSIAAVPAAAGIPVTHRGVSQSVTLVTGRGEDGSEPDYQALAAVGGTLVFFMSLGRLERVAAGLIGAGLPARTAAAVVSRGTLEDQASVSAPLGMIASAARDLPSPALLVVGDVVDIAEAIRLAAAGAAA